MITSRLGELYIYSMSELRTWIISDYLFFFVCLKIDPPPPLLCTQLIRVDTIRRAVQCFSLRLYLKALAPADLLKLSVAVVVKIYVQARGTVVRQME